MKKNIIFAVVALSLLSVFIAVIMLGNKSDGIELLYQPVRAKSGKEFVLVIDDGILYVTHNEETHTRVLSEFELDQVDNLIFNLQKDTSFRRDFFTTYYDAWEVKANIFGKSYYSICSRPNSPNVNNNLVLLLEYLAEVSPIQIGPEREPYRQ